ncbi:hypothetical protein [Georgenia muralis]
MRLLVSLTCLAYVLWLPVSNGQVLYPVLGLLAMTGLIAGQRPARWFVAAGLLTAIAVMLMAVVGSFHNTPGLNHQIALWAGGLVVWAAWANGINRTTIRVTLQVITWGTIVLAAVIVLYVGSQQGLPALVPPPLLEMQGAGFDLTAAGTAIRFYGLSTLAAAGPLVAAGAVARRDDLLPSRRLLIVAAVLAVLAAVLAGRRAVLVTTILAPVLYLALARVLHGRSGGPVRVPVGLAIAAPVLLVAGYLTWGTAAFVRARAALTDVAYVYTGIGEGSGSKAGGDALRVAQSGQMFDAWGERPFLGNGLGAAIPGYRRNDEQPWMFELQYHQLLFDGGLIGVALLAVAAVIVAAATVRTARRLPEHQPVIAVTGVTALGMLLSNASNPYLQAPAHWWAVALLIGVVNVLSRDQVTDRSPVPFGPGYAQATGGLNRHGFVAASF